MIVLDGSGSVTLPNFKIMLNFTKALVDVLDMGFYHCRLGIVRFEFEPDLIFKMNQYYTDDGLKNAIDNIYYPTGGTRTDLLLNFMRERFYWSPWHGGREEIVDIMIVITDGASNVPIDNEAAQFLTTGVTTFAFGITGANYTELQLMATDPDDRHVMYTSSFEKMYPYVWHIRDEICKYSKSCCEIYKLSRNARYSLDGRYASIASLSGRYMQV